MNEKIRELADQAGADFSVPIFSDNDKGSEFRHFDVGKFSELIQKETIKQCRDMFIVGSVSWNLLNDKLEYFGGD